MSDGKTSSSLYGLLKARRQNLIDRWLEKINAAFVDSSDQLSRAALLDRIPLFVDELIAALYPDVAPLPANSANAEEHGVQRYGLGFNMSEVVREYGALQSSIIDLACEAGIGITLAEQEVLGRWLNAGIANAISQYVSQRDVEFQRQASEHLGFIAHEVRNPLSAVQMAFDRLRLRELAQPSRTVAILERNLHRTLSVVDSVLTHASLRLGVTARPETVNVRHLLEEIAFDIGIAAQEKGVTMELEGRPELVIQADTRLLRSAISNLVQNAVKFTNPHSRIVLRARQDDHRVLIDVADGCGGLPSGKADELFDPLVQRGDDRTGFGMGLAIALQAAQAHGGTVKVHDVPGTGCVFTVDLPARTA
jgi:signal transduction histidine kinase